MKNNNNISSKEMIDFITKYPKFQLFHDEKQASWVRIEDASCLKIFSCESKAFTSWCRGVIHFKFDVNPSREGLTSLIELLKAKAIWESNEYELHNRVAWYGENLIYDLSNKSWEKVLITPSGWRVLEKENDPILFKRYSHQKSQVSPSQGVDPLFVKRIFNYINIVEEDQKILFLVWLISCFIPDFPHPLMYVYGPQGSAKSSISKIVREIIDPSILEVGTLPKNHEGLIQQLDHNWMNFFDNVSYIDQNMSDLLCKSITGIGVSKRELYTNDEDIIYNFKRCIGINGINLEGVQPDLLERSILFNLKRMDDSNRLSEDKLKKDFEEDKSKILGAIFTILSQALDIKRDVELERTPRMADFTLWGCAIAEAIGYEMNDFLDAYLRNIDSQVEEGINSSGIALTIQGFMINKQVWEGTARKLYRELSESLYFENEKATRVDFPKNEVILGKNIGKIEVILSKVGIVVERERGEQRIIRLINKKFIPDTSDSNDGLFPDLKDSEL